MTEDQIREEAPYVKAREFVEWLIDRYGDEAIMAKANLTGERWPRRWYHWREEQTTGVICVYKLDEFLRDVFGMECMLHDVPTELFTFRPKKYKSKYTDKVRREAVRRALAGETYRAVCDDLHVSRAALSNWIKLHRRAEQLEAA